MDWQAWFEDFSDKMSQISQGMRDYFSDLNQEEQYGWLAMAIGTILFVAGVVKLIL